jgi:hypothetical protein
MSENDRKKHHNYHASHHTFTIKNHVLNPFFLQTPL